ncbi:MAG: autotransporter-associated beta strand repeat-containing protein, partial [Verrucomicrobiae bacterium]|nr:autotransporter-associated beta strand repeat-containing protein [Verrucomicrobiae bacterium]
YEFQVTGATPKDAGTGSTNLITHANGGGLKASTATVASTAYIGPNARVLDYAVVKENARVEDNAVVSGHALLRDSAIARGNAKIREHVLMQDTTIAEGNARVGGHAWLMQTTRVTDNATIKGAAQVYGSGVVSGDAVLDGDSTTGSNMSNGFQFGWAWGGQAPEVIASRTAPARLFSSYEFSSAHPYAVKDKYGVTDAPLVGTPTWWASDGIRDGFLSFNGSGQYAILNRWHNDFHEMTITASVSWNGGSNNQALFSFGDGTAAKQMVFTPKNGAGVCELKIVSGGNTYNIAGSSALEVGRWTRVGVLLDGTTASLYLDGDLAASAACPVRPHDLLPADTTETPAHNFLARGTGMQDFSGSIDEFNIYSAATTSVLTPSSLEADLLAWYKFDETSGTVADDSSPNNSDATLVNGPAWNSGALSFDGIDDDVQTPVPNGSVRTLAAWIYPRSSDPVGNIESVFDCDIPGQYGTGWGLSGGFIRVILDNQFWDTGVPVTLNQWQHVALAYDATQARVYVDGTLQATLDYTQGGVTAANFRIGRSNANALFFHGDIRDAKIYGRAVNDLEILEVVNGAVAAPSLAPQNLAATPGTGEITLTWDPANDGESWYAVRRSTTPGGPYLPASGAVAGTTFSDTDVTPGITYHYVVIAVNSSGNGPASAEASAIISPVWNNSAGTGLWNTTDANWTGTTWTDGADAVFAHTAAAETVTVSGSRSADAVKIGNGSNNANYTFAGSSLAANSLTLQGVGDNHLGTNPTATFNDLALTLTGDLAVGRANLVIGGNSTITADRLGGLIGGVTSADWGLVTIQDNAQVSLDNGVLANTTAWGLNLDGGTLTTRGIEYGPHDFVGSSRLNFNGTLVKANANNLSFLSYSGGDYAAPQILAGGALIDTDGHEITIGLDLAGTGALTKSGSGTLTLTAVSNYTGGTIVDDGKLVLASGNANGTGRIRGALTVNASGTVETTGDSTGLGWVDQISSVNINGGAVTSPGAMHIWNISGGITMTGGLLQSNNGTSDPNGPQLEWNRTNLTTLASTNTATIAGRIRMRNEGGYPGITFTVADGPATTDLLVSAAITEASAGLGITKAGAGTMKLAGANTFTGTTAVNEGTLQITGSLAGPVSVETDGTLAPGASIGTLTVPSSSINGALAIEIDGASADRLDVTGNLNITNATLALSGTLTADEYIIASYGTLTGSTFAAITGLPEGYEVDYSNNQIRL